MEPCGHYSIADAIFNCRDCTANLIGGKCLAAFNRHWLIFHRHWRVTSVSRIFENRFSDCRNRVNRFCDWPAVTSQDFVSVVESKGGHLSLDDRADERV